MKIRIRTKTMNLSLPVPVSAAGMVIRKIPDSVFANLQKSVPEPYSAFCSREALLFLVRECAERFARSTIWRLYISRRRAGRTFPLKCSEEMKEEYRNEGDWEKMMKQNTQKQSGRSSCWRGILSLAIMLTAAVFFYGCSLGGGQSDQASLQSEEDLTAYFLDVGQADSTLLVSQGEAVLIDAGNRDDAEFILGYIKNLGIDHLKYVIFTHPA